MYTHIYHLYYMFSERENYEIRMVLFLSFTVSVYLRLESAI